MGMGSSSLHYPIPGFEQRILNKTRDVDDGIRGKASYDKA